MACAHQLRLVDHIYSAQANVKIFDLSPLYAFSGLTSQTAIGFSIYNSMWFITAPEWMTHPVGIMFWIFYTVMAIVTFMWPLMSIHRRAHVLFIFDNTYFSL